MPTNIHDDDDLPKNHDDELLNVYGVNTDVRSEYYGFKLYFDGEDLDKNPQLHAKIQAADEFMKQNSHFSTLHRRGEPSFKIDIDRFYSNHDFIMNWPSFKSDLQYNPRETLNCLGLVLYHRIILNLISENPGQSMISHPMVRVQIFNYRPILAVNDIKLKSYGQLIATRGCVIRVGRAKELAQWILFACVKCDNHKIVKQPQGIYTVPRKCDVCGPSKFHPKLDSVHDKTVPFQVIKLQEHLDAMQDDRGKMPRIIEIELIDTLVGSCCPGDHITVVGIIRARGTDDGKSKTRDEMGSNTLYMEAVSIMDNKNKSQTKSAIAEFDQTDLDTIALIQRKPDIFPLLVRSLCPAIYGHEMVKAGLLLSLLGGTSKPGKSRDDIHVLMVGDPGLGKSQLLQACTRIAAQGIYVCGNSSSSSGLTVTLTKESGTSDFALEPGALVLADQGTCLIDEFDKMPTQHQALLEAMEQQSVSVAKSGVMCTLKARTSILAAANPVEGRYNPEKAVVNNLNMSQPLLSRFDLVFLLRDNRSLELDSELCSHMLNAQKKYKKFIPDSNSMENFVPARSYRKLATLRERILADDDEVLPQAVLRKYISYAKQWVKPTLNDAAKKVLQKFYLELRTRQNIFGSLPVYHRQLEALIRLTEARAKSELRVEATESDANEIVELFQFTLDSVPDTNVGAPTGARGVPKNDTGKITANKVLAFIGVLKNAEKTTFSMTDLNTLAEENGILVTNFTGFISKLNSEGILLKRGNDKYQFVAE